MGGGVIGALDLAPVGEGKKGRFMAIGVQIDGVWAVRILSLDGGGIRGLLISETLRRLEAQTGRRIADLFDLVCGTSTGGFIALAIAQRKQLDDVAAEYEALRKKVRRVAAPARRGAPRLPPGVHQTKRQP